MFLYPFGTSKNYLGWKQTKFMPTYKSNMTTVCHIAEDLLKRIQKPYLISYLLTKKLKINWKRPVLMLWKAGLLFLVFVSDFFFCEVVISGSANSVKINSTSSLLPSTLIFGWMKKRSSFSWDKVQSTSCKITNFTVENMKILTFLNSW